MKDIEFQQDTKNGYDDVRVIVDGDIYGYLKYIYDFTGAGCWELWIWDYNWAWGHYSDSETVPYSESLKATEKAIAKEIQN